MLYIVSKSSKQAHEYATSKGLHYYRYISPWSKWIMYGKKSAIVYLDGWQDRQDASHLQRYIPHLVSIGRVVVIAEDALETIPPDCVEYQNPATKFNW